MPVPLLLSPRLLGAHVLAIVCVGAAALLGAWQYDAWQARRAAAASDLTSADPVPLASVLGPDAPFPGDRVGQPVFLEGTWLPDATVFVSGRERAGRVGYWTVTPLATPAGAAIPVVRGWVAEPAAAPPPPTGAAELIGWLQPPQGTGERDPDPTDDVVPQLRVADLIQRVNEDLYGAYAVVVPPDRAPSTTVNDGTAGLAPATLDQLPEAGAFTAARNLFYAVEWWFFGGFAVFIWWRYLRDELTEDRTPAATPDPVASRT